MSQGSDLSDESILAVAAHELSGPLTILLMKLSELSERGHQAYPDVQLMLGEVRRMARLVDDYLVTEQLGHRPLCLEVEALPIAEVMASVADRVALWAGDEPRRLVESGLRAWADRTRLEQVLWNLLQNAYRYGARPVQAAAWADGEEVQIIISDCGDGIPEHLRAGVTTMFEQGHDAHRDGIGVGLGLSTTIIEAHGGRLWIEQAPCGGAAIHLALERAGTA